MPSGKGTLDCCYCTRFRGHRSHHEPGQSDFHRVPIPASDLNRVCVHFEPTASYFYDQGSAAPMPPACRFTWFREDLEVGVLYEFFHASPENIERRTVLRVFDRSRGEWMPGPSQGGGLDPSTYPTTPQPPTPLQYFFDPPRPAERTLPNELSAGCYMAVMAVLGVALVSIGVVLLLAILFPQ
jgi:hypothetical protein